MLHLLYPLVVCGEYLESGSSGLGVATSSIWGDLRCFYIILLYCKFVSIF